METQAALGRFLASVVLHLLVYSARWTGSALQRITLSRHTIGIINGAEPHRACFMYSLCVRARLQSCQKEA